MIRMSDCTSTVCTNNEVSVENLPAFLRGIWNFSTSQAEGACMTSPHFIQTLGTKSLMDFPEQQCHTCCYIFVAEGRVLSGKPSRERQRERRKRRERRQETCTWISPGSIFFLLSSCILTKSL